MKVYPCDGGGNDKNATIFANFVILGFSTHLMQLKLAERRRPEEKYKALRSEESLSKLWVGFEGQQHNDSGGGRLKYIINGGDAFVGQEFPWLSFSSSQLLSLFLFEHHCSDFRSCYFLSRTIAPSLARYKGHRGGFLTLYFR